jgi:hypothetical protein
MDNNKTAQIATVVTNASETAVTAAPTREFIEPEISEPVDILAATRFFLQVTGGGDV